MAGPFVGLKLDLVRKTWSGTWSANAAAGVAVGTVLAVATVVLGALRSPAPAAQSDLLALVVAAWVLGWAVAPALSGEPLLPARFFTHLGLPRLRLGVGLLVTTVVGLPGAVTLVALTSIPVFAGRSAAATDDGGGSGAVVAAVVGTLPVVALLLVLAGLACLLAARLFSSLSSTRPGAVVTGALVGLLLVSTQWGWIVLIAIDAVWSWGFSATTTDVIGGLPTSWGVHAAEAAAGGDAGRYVGWAAALLGLDAALLALWVRLVDVPPRRLAVQGPRRRRSGRRPGSPTGTRWLPAGTGVVLRREMTSWARDVTRVQAVAASVVFAAATATLPLAFDSEEVLPWAGVMVVLMLAATTSNLVGQDGTVLWLGMQTPGALPADVRGRQLAWSLVALVSSLPLAVAGAWWGGFDSAALLATVVMAVAGGGVVVWLSIVGLVPAPDPRAARDRPLDHGDVTGQAFVALLLVALVAAPVIAVGVLTSPAPAVGALGVAASLAGAVALAAAAGGVAARHLEGRAPELLAAMRSRRSGGTASTDAGGTADALAELSGRQRLVLQAAITIGMIALFPQALVPTVMKLTGDVAPVWFLALHLPSPWQWPVIVAMVGIAGASFWIAYRIYRPAR